MKKLTPAQSTVIAAIITGVFGVIVAMLAWQKNPRLPSAIPSLTPQPTVVGTPVELGTDISVRGQIGFTVSAGNIILVIDEVNAYRQTLYGRPARTGYVFIVVKLRISNGSHHFINSLYTTVADDLGNRYAPKITAVEFDLPELPSLQNGDSGAGAIVYELPEVALSNNLRFWLEPLIWIDDNDPSVKIEILFPSIMTVIQ